MKTLYTGLVCKQPDYIHTPLIEIKPLADDSALRLAIDRWYANETSDARYLLFTSRYAVKYWSLLVKEKGLPPNAGNCRVVSIGATTTKALSDAGFTNVEQVEKDDSYGVIDWFSRQTKGSVLIPRSNLGLPIIPNGLKDLGYDVEAVIAYTNQFPDNPVKIDIDDVDCIVFTSPSTIDNFIILYGSLPTDKRMVTRGAVTENHLNEILNRK